MTGVRIVIKEFTNRDWLTLAEFSESGYVSQEVNYGNASADAVAYFEGLKDEDTTRGEHRAISQAILFLTAMMPLAERISRDRVYGDWAIYVTEY